MVPVPSWDPNFSSAVKVYREYSRVAEDYPHITPAVFACVSRPPPICTFPPLALKVLH